MENPIMKPLKKILLVVGLLALAGCAGGGFGKFGSNGADGALANGAASDPNSPAYFEQAIGDRILFAVDQSSLSPEAITVLDGQATWLLANAEFVASIEGHADEQGTREYNLALSARRANSVQEYLITRGVSPDRLRVIPYGKERPLAICSNESCYSQNRRAVTVLAAGGLS